MSPKRRKPENSDLPVGLSLINKRGKPRFRYRYPDGKDFWFPQDTKKVDAVVAVRLFNDKHRQPVFDLSKTYDVNDKPLYECVPLVIQRISDEEDLAPETLNTLKKDAERLTDLHGNVSSKSVDLNTVNEYLNKYCEGKSNNVYNRKIQFLVKVFDYMLDLGLMTVNPAKLKKTKRKEEKARTRLSLSDFQEVHTAAPDWLKTAMELSLQTTHAVNEISRLKYSDCENFDKPKYIDGFTVYGYIKIQRQKTQKQETSRVRIPITEALKGILADSRNNVVSQYVVHRLGRYSKQISEGCDHPTQVSSKMISREFSKVRDRLGLFKHMPKNKRPTYHEIRALAAFLYNDMGHSPQERMAHKNSESTKKYLTNHKPFITVKPSEVRFKKK